ncbi:hypothetical protein CJF42_07600 [Pseudoalteromonas sp. NBT06-2]|nr:hypothetical protein CJF42_07600 [Pseudoalteromonas sp. NBT06-2]
MFYIEGLPIHMLSKIKNQTVINIDQLSYEMLSKLPNYYVKSQHVYLQCVYEYLSFRVIGQGGRYKVGMALHYKYVNKSNFSQISAYYNFNSINYVMNKNNSEYYKLAEKTEKYLIKHLSQEIQLNELAFKMATNRNKLSKAFKAQFGTTVIKWLRKQRMIKAQEMLRNSNISMQEIASQVGYVNAANFSTAYRQVFDKSPRKERQTFSI